MRSRRSVITRTRYSQEVLRLDAERLGEPLHDLVRRHRPVAVHEVVQIARREAALRAEAAEGDARLVHQPLERRAERLLAELAPRAPSRDHRPGRRSQRAARRRSSGRPRRRPRASSCPRPRESGRRSGRRRRTSRPPAGRGRPAARRDPPRRSARAACAACSSSPGSATMWTSYGATEAGQRIPWSSSCCCSTIAAITRAGPDAVAAADERLLLAVLVEEGRAERLRVARPELEDVPDLDRRLEAQRAAAVRARVALARLAEVGEARLEVAAVLDAAQVRSRCDSRRRRTGPRAASRRRRSRPRSPPGRASPGRRRTPRGSPPRSPAGSRSRARSRASPPRAGRRRGSSASTSVPSVFTTGIAFDVAAASMPRKSASASIVVTPGVSTSSGASSRSGNSGARGTPRAISRSAA